MQHYSLRARDLFSFFVFWVRVFIATFLHLFRYTFGIFKKDRSYKKNKKISIILWRAVVLMWIDLKRKNVWEDKDLGDTEYNFPGRICSFQRHSLHGKGILKRKMRQIRGKSYTLHVKWGWKKISKILMWLRFLFWIILFSYEVTCLLSQK